MNANHMPGWGDVWAAPYTGRSNDPRTPLPREEEQEDERTDDGAPEDYDIETGDTYD